MLVRAPAAWDGVRRSATLTSADARLKRKAGATTPRAA